MSIGVNISPIIKGKSLIEKQKVRMIIAEPYSPLASPLKNKKENKKRSYNKKLHHPMNFLEEFITPPLVSLTLYTPKGKAEANSLTNGYAVLPGEDRATLESDPSALGSPSRGAPLRKLLPSRLIDL